MLSFWWLLLCFYNSWKVCEVTFLKRIPYSQNSKFTFETRQLCSPWMNFNYLIQNCPYFLPIPTLQGLMYYFWLFVPKKLLHICTNFIYLCSEFTSICFLQLDNKCSCLMFVWWPWSYCKNCECNNFWVKKRKKKDLEKKGSESVYLLCLYI